MNGISVIVPTLNEQRYVGALLSSFAKQTGPPPFEVIVVDSSDDDLTREAVLSHAHTLDLRYLHIDVKDIGAQRNEGAARAKYDLLLFVDADVVASSAVLNACFAAAPDRPFVGAVRHRADIDTLATRIGLRVIYVLFALPRLIGIGVTNGDFLLTSRATFDRINGFREGYLLGEDTDFGVRACRSGAKYVFVPREYIVASSRRLTQMPVSRLIVIWSRAFMRTLFRGPTPRSSGIDYPFGRWT